MAVRRWTRQRAAESLRDSQFRILIGTTDRQVFLLAQQIDDLTLSAINCLDNARQYDASTGGGSGSAWGYRTKAARVMKKAVLIEKEQAAHNVSMAGRKRASLAEILFLAYVERTGGGQFQRYQLVVENCLDKQFVKAAWSRGTWQCEVTEKGLEQLEALRDSVEELEIEAFKVKPGDPVSPALAAKAFEMAQIAPGLREGIDLRALLNDDGSWKFEIRAKQIGNLAGCAEHNRHGDWWPLGTYDSIDAGSKVAERMREGTHFLDVRISGLREWGEDAYAEVRAADEAAEAATEALARTVLPT